MEIFHCAGPVDAEVPMYDGPCDGADRPAKTQVIPSSNGTKNDKYCINNKLISCGIKIENVQITLNIFRVINHKQIIKIRT